MQQGLEYAETLDVPFVFSTNGDGFLLHASKSKGSEQIKGVTEQIKGVRTL